MDKKKQVGSSICHQQPWRELIRTMNRGFSDIMRQQAPSSIFHSFHLKYEDGLDRGGLNKCKAMIPEHLIR